MNKMILGCSLAMVLVAGVVGCDTLPPATEDTKLAQAALERLYQDKLVSHEVLGVTVQKGVATLHGTISDEGLRARAKSIVQNTPGVVEVKDETVRR